MIKYSLKEIRDWAFLLLAIGTILIGLGTLNLQKNSNPSIRPDIQIDLIDGSFINSERLASIWHMENGTFDPQKGYFHFKITNLGLKSSGILNINMKDPLGEYEFEAESIEELESLDYKTFMIPFLNRYCEDVSHETRRNDDDWKVASNNCRDIRENLTQGKRDLYLRVSCVGCEFDNKIVQCYSFETCIYDFEENSCGEDPRYYSLKEEDCLEDWWN